jgi:hypothetical protein
VRSAAPRRGGNRLSALMPGFSSFIGATTATVRRPGSASLRATGMSENWDATASEICEQTIPISSGCGATMYWQHIHAAMKLNWRKTV